MQELFGRIQGLALIAFFAVGSCQIMGQEFKIGNSQIVGNPGIPIYPGFPDGHISFIKKMDGSMVQIWAGYDSYISSGPTFLQQDSVWGCKLTKGVENSFDNGGAWLYSVHPLDANRWIGFYHAEDHVFGNYVNNEKIAWKSAAQCISLDGGNSWTKNGQIITTWESKPDKPTWGGTGDFSVVRDSLHNRWVAFFVCPDGIGMAESFDEYGAPGTWMKFYKGTFCEKGMGGKGSAIDCTKGKKAGGNPSVIYHIPTKKWLMVYHDWNEKGIYLTTSEDLTHWEEATLILKNPGSPQKIWYPTLFSDNSDKVCNDELYLAYAQWDDVSLPYRNFKFAPVYYSSLSTPAFNSNSLLSTSDLVLSDTLSVTLQLYDLTGKCVHNFYTSTMLTPGCYPIDANPYIQKGIFILRAQLNDKIQSVKIIKL